MVTKKIFKPPTSLEIGQRRAQADDLRVRQGLTLNVDRMHQRLAEIERLHENLMRQAKCLVLRTAEE